MTAMTTTKPNTRSRKSVLDAEESRRVIAIATDGKEAIHLRADPDQRDETITGIIVGRDERNITVELGPIDQRTRSLIDNTSLRATVDVSGIRYAFQTKCLALATEPDRDLATLVSPKELEIVERRRIRRRLFRSTSEVVLRVGDRSARELRADMLNVSSDGIACRVGSSDVGGITVGDAIRIAATLGPSPRVHDLRARVVSITGGGTCSRVVLGMEFVAGDDLEAFRWNLHNIVMSPS